MKIYYQGIPINFTSSGSGRPLVLLHGFLETIKIWEPFLSDLIPNRQVICIDLPGHGCTGNFGEIHTMELMAEVVYKVLEHLNIPRAAFAGHSMGGYVSLSFAEKYSDSLSGLALINSTPEDDSEDRKKVRDRAVQLVTKNKKAYVNMAISNLAGPQGNKIFRDEIKELKEEALKMSNEGITASLRGMKIRTNKINFLKSLKTTKIMISATDDPIMPYDHANNIATLCNCPIITVSGGHLSYLENYSQILQILHFID